jgi:hypothetical protein
MIDVMRSIRGAAGPRPIPSGVDIIRGHSYGQH